MRFGISKFPSDFERIFYVYADGTVVALKGGSAPIPSAVSLPDGEGYPAVTLHQFSIPLDVPSPGHGKRGRQFDTFRFDETIVAPLDTWMMGREPNIERPKFTASVRVTSDRANIKILRDGITVIEDGFDTINMSGKTMYMHCVLEWSIRKTTFTYTV